MAWAPRVVWRQVTVAPGDGGHAVLLDGRPLRTPARAPLRLPAAALAEAVAAEWRAQRDRVRPATMPLTRLASTAIDRVAPQHAAVAGIVAAYGATDLLCYRAAAPAALAARQAAAWDPLLAWAAAALAAPLAVGQGVMPVPQPAAAAPLAARVRACGAFELAALHDLAALTGSLVLALAVREGRLGAAEAFRLSRIDEDWQAELWGSDAEAAAAAALRAADAEAAGRFLALLADGSGDGR
jgi:chaperone required for assembly of F1-ATPase